MRRSAGVVLSAILLALLPALLANIASASPTIRASAPYDFSGAAFRTIFGETTDARASLAASYGDRASESPLRDLAMMPSRESTISNFAPDVAATPSFADGQTARRPSLGVSNVVAFGGGAFVPNDSSFIPASIYAPVQPIAIDAPRTIDSIKPSESIAAPADAAPATGASIAAAPNAFASSALATKNDSLASGFAPNAVLVPVSLRLGRLQFDGKVGGAEQTQSTPSQSDNGYGAGANFDVRAGAHRVNVDVTSSYEHLMRDDTTAYSSALPGVSQWQIGGDAAPSLPSYADMSKLALGAKLAVPVTQTMTLGLNYNAQRLLGEYGLPGIVNLDAIDNSYGGNVTFALPRWSSQVSVSASQYHYQDNIAPANTFSDLRGNVNFTVKF